MHQELCWTTTIETWKARRCQLWEGSTALCQINVTQVVSLESTKSFVKFQKAQSSEVTLHLRTSEQEALRKCQGMDTFLLGDEDLT